MFHQDWCSQKRSRQYDRSAFQQGAASAAIEAKGLLRARDMANIRTQNPSFKYTPIHHAKGASSHERLVDQGTKTLPPGRTPNLLSFLIIPRGI